MLCCEIHFMGVSALLHKNCNKKQREHNNQQPFFFNKNQTNIFDVYPQDTCAAEEEGVEEVSSLLTIH